VPVHQARSRQLGAAIGIVLEALLVALLVVIVQPLGVVVDAPDVDDDVEALQNCDSDEECKIYERLIAF
jgi:hypothetical protein